MNETCKLLEVSYNLILSHLMINTWPWYGLVWPGKQNWICDLFEVFIRLLQPPRISLTTPKGKLLTCKQLDQTLEAWTRVVNLCLLRLHYSVILKIALLSPVRIKDFRRDELKPETTCNAPVCNVLKPANLHQYDMTRQCIIFIATTLCNFVLTSDLKTSL